MAGGESANDVLGIQEIDDMIHTPINQQLRDIWGWMYAGVNRANYNLSFKTKILTVKDKSLLKLSFKSLLNASNWSSGLEMPQAVDRRILFGRNLR